MSTIERVLYSVVIVTLLAAIVTQSSSNDQLQTQPADPAKAEASE